jgi:hypothetical protein
VFAQIQAVTSDECSGLPMLPVMPRPNGAACVTGADCVSGLCTAAALDVAPGDVFGTVCSDCEYGQPTDTCPGAEICGYADPTSPILAGSSTCIPEASRELGEACLVDAECSSGTCDHAVCSACRLGGAACANGQACGLAWGDLFNPGPSVCGGGTGAIASGEACGANGDCASGVCNGSERRECSDGRACNSRSDCPVGSGLIPGECTTVGVQGGTCQ